MPTTHPPDADHGVFVVVRSLASLKPDLLDALPDSRAKPDLVLGEADADELVAEVRELFEQQFKIAMWLEKMRPRTCDAVRD